MPIQTHIAVNAAKFDPKNENEQTQKLNAHLESIFENNPRWWEVGPARYREMRLNGEVSLPKPVLVRHGTDTSIPSRDTGREIPVRVIKPQKSQSKGLLMHIHGGGWVLMSEKFQDQFLEHIAEKTSLTVVSVGYRLAPENPFPAGPNDCYDAAEYLVDNGPEKFGGELMFTGGESAGAHLSLLTCLHLLRTRASFAFRGLILHYGWFDLSGLLPSVHHFSRSLVINPGELSRFVAAFLPGFTEADRRSPNVSPFFADLRPLRGRLPPALFAVGTEDPLLDDSLMMGVRWQAAGAEGVVRVYPGAPHGFSLFPLDSTPSAKEGMEDTLEFILRRMG